MSSYPLATLGDTAGVRAPWDEPDGRVRLSAAILIAEKHRASAAYDERLEGHRARVASRWPRGTEHVRRCGRTGSFERGSERWAAGRRPRHFSLGKGRPLSGGRARRGARAP